MQIHVKNIPGLLRNSPQWVLWRFEERDGKRTKPPFQPNGSHASHADPATWGTFEDVYSAFLEGEWEGLGFALADTDPLAGIDLDHCVTADGIEPWAQAIIDRIQSYTEISPSGTGVRIFLRGRLPEGASKGGRKLGGQGPEGAGAIELYCRLRYLTVTGQHLPGTPAEIRDVDAAFQELYRELFPDDKPAPKPTANTPPPVSLSDHELLLKMFAGKNGAAIFALWNGDTSAYGSHSEADAALCAHLAFWCARDEAWMDRLFRQSRLMRDKWDEERPGGTYGSNTIELGVSGCSEVYEGPSQQLDISDLEAYDEQRTRTQEAAERHQDALGTARELVQDLAAKLKADVSAAFNEELLEAFGILRALDKGAWQRCRAILTKYKVSLRMLEPELPPVEKYLPREATPGAVPGTYVSAVLPGCPAPTFLIPEPYYLSETATGRKSTDTKGRTQRNDLASAPIVILGRTRSVSNGNESLLLGTKWPRGPWITRVVPRAKVFTGKEILQLADHGFPIAEDNKGDIITYLRHAEAANRDELPVAKITNHLGWQGDPRTAPFLCGQSLIDPGGAIETVNALDTNHPETWSADRVCFLGGTGTDFVAEAFRAQGSFEEWLTAVSVLARHPVALAVFYAGLAAPLLAPFDIPNFVIDLAYDTTVGKTTALQASASHWGNPDASSEHSVVGTWDSTRVGMERTTEAITHLPLFMDDTKTVKFPKQIADLLYAVTSGRGRKRGTVDGIAKTATWRTVMFSTGEQPATSFTQDGGTRTRVLGFGQMPFGGQTPELSLLTSRLGAKLKAHHGHSGPRWLSWLIQNRNTWDDWQARHQTMVERLLTRAASPESGRLAPYAALISIVGEMAHRALPLPWRFIDPIPEIWASLAEGAADAAGTLRALDDVLSWAASNETKFIGRSGTSNLFGPETDHIPSTCYGRWDLEDDWQFLAIYPTVLKETLSRLGYAESAILKGWRERGFIKCRDGKFTSDVPIGQGTNTRKMVVLKRDAFEPKHRSEGAKNDV